MDRRGSRLRGCMGVACWLMLNGCVSLSHQQKDMPAPESASSIKSEVKKPAADKPTPAQGTTAAQPQTAPMPPSQPSLPEPKGYRISGDAPLVAERISLYQQKKSEWKAAEVQLAGLGDGNIRPAAWNECLQDIDMALAGYQRLQTGTEPDLNPWEPLGRDLHYFATECNQVLAAAPPKASASQEPTPNLAPDGAVSQIRQSFETGLYQEVVNACDALPHGKDGTLPGPKELKILYSRALVKLGRFQEAANALKKLMEVNPSMDATTLDSRVLTGDVLLAMGQDDEARQVYAGLATALAPVVNQQEWITAHIRAFGAQANTEDIGIYRELLQAYLRFDGQQVPPTLVDGVARLQGRPNNSFVELAKMLLAKATAQSQAWTRSQVLAIKALIAAHNLGRARELLQPLSAAAPATMKSSISQLESELAQAESAAKESPKALEEAQTTSPWEEALHLFEQKKYDEAIAGFKQLLDSEHGAAAKAKITEASELAAAAMRQQAAALYAKAKKTFDPEAKRQALLSSRSLLQSLIEKYPDSTVTDKARQNLKVLDAELGQTSITSPAPADPKKN